MTKIVSTVLCPACKSVYTIQEHSQGVDIGVFTAWHSEKWKCGECGKEFAIGCERKMSYYIYTDEEFADDEDYEIAYEEE